MAILNVMLFLMYLFKFEVPEECVPRTPRIVMEEVPGMLSDMNDVRPEVVAMKCVYENNVYNDGDNWKATHVDCQMCSCNRFAIFQQISTNFYQCNSIFLSVYLN